RGKCSYKMLLYMSSGVPVVVSPVGMNADVLTLGPVGLGPRTDREWTDALVDLATNADWRLRAGVIGREIVLHHFEREQVAAQLAGVLRGAARSRAA
ncbi:MAG: group 1 glycosyl transferase, partial [Acidobacteria bacterium]|nr:group 1 glycosyl transferase [Acidobacteriota bacterium]